jgi:hypothetical protein
MFFGLIGFAGVVAASVASPLVNGRLRSVFRPHPQAERTHIGLTPNLAPPCGQQCVVGLGFRPATTGFADETRVRLARDLEQ